MPQKKWFLWFVYHHPLGYPLLLIFRMRFFSQMMGWIFQTSFSRVLITPLKKYFRIDTSSCIIPDGDFQTLNDFFIRQKTSSSLTFPSGNFLGSPVDGCVEIFPSLDVKNKHVVKWYHLSLLDIFWPDVHDFSGWDLCFFRLRFSDYHRFHFFDEGSVLSSVERNGPLYSVDSTVLDTGFWIQNKSHLMRLRTVYFGEVLWLEMGATNVGSIIQHKKMWDTFCRWEEKWYFQLWWSAILIVFQRWKISWKWHLLQSSRELLETEVSVGMSLGESSTSTLSSQ